jgi:4-amino-4-deoxy-L-arabinose transferase-like glycosyltransferase
MKRIVSSVEKQFKENKELMIGLGFFLFYLAMINLPPLLEPDEGRYIEIPREMLALRDFILPHLNGVLYFEKPPLYYWLNSLSVAIFGISLVAARIWSVIMAVLTILFTGKLARRFFGREAGVTAEIILGSSFLFMGLACFNTLDMTLTFFLTACIGCFFLATSSDRRNLNFWLMFAASAGAVMTKGLIGLVIPGGIVFFYLLISGRWRLLRVVPWVSGIALFLILAVPWHVAAALRNPDFLYFYFIHEHFLRYATTIAHRTQPWYFFIAVLLVGSFPWIYLFPRVIKHTFSTTLKELRQNDILYFLLWIVFPVVFFSLSESKLVTYILPVFPPLAVLFARDFVPARNVNGPDSPSALHHPSRTTQHQTDAVDPKEEV